MGFLDLLRDSGAPATTAEANRLALKQPEGRGADLTQPRHVVHRGEYDGWEAAYRP